MGLTNYSVVLLTRLFCRNENDSEHFEVATLERGTILQPNRNPSLPIQKQRPKTDSEPFSGTWIYPITFSQAGLIESIRCLEGVWRWPHFFLRRNRE